MQVGGVVTDETAVSPVISVVLMLAVTVTLAAVVGAFVFGFDQPQESAPQAEFDFEKLERPPGDNDEVEITHANGAAIQNDHLFVVTDAGVRDTDGSPSAGARLSWFRLAEDDGATEGDTLTVGDSVRFETSAEEIEDTEVRLVWQPEASGPSAVIARWITRS